MEFILKKIDAELARPRIDKTRLLELIKEIVITLTSGEVIINGTPGEQGERGPRGPPGEKGEQGPRGLRGPEGICKCVCKNKAPETVAPAPAKKVTKKKTVASTSE